MSEWVMAETWSERPKQSVNYISNEMKLEALFFWHTWNLL